MATGPGHWHLGFNGFPAPYPVTSVTVVLLGLVFPSQAGTWAEPSFPHSTRRLSVTTELVLWLHTPSWDGLLQSQGLWELRQMHPTILCKAHHIDIRELWEGEEAAGVPRFKGYGAYSQRTLPSSHVC